MPAAELSSSSLGGRRSKNNGKSVLGLESCYAGTRKFFDRSRFLWPPTTLIRCRTTLIRCRTRSGWEPRLSVSTGLNGVQRAARPVITMPVNSQRPYTCLCTLLRSSLCLYSAAFPSCFKRSVIPLSQTDEATGQGGRLSRGYFHQLGHHARMRDKQKERRKKKHNISGLD
jgi:hypothetical protein